MSTIPAQVLEKLSDDDLAKISSAKDVNSALESLSDDALHKISSYKPPQGPSNLEDHGTAYTKNILFGTRPFVAGVGGGVGSAVAQLDNPNLGLVDRIKGLPEAFQQGFSGARSGALAEEADLEKRRPGLNLAYGIGTGLATAPLFAAKGLQAASVAAKTAQAAGGGSKLMAIGKGLVAGAPEAARLGTGFGALQALGHAENANDAINQTLTGTAIGAGAQVGLNAAGMAIPAAWNATKWAGKKAMTTFLGPKQEAIDSFMQGAGQRAAEIKGANSVEQIKNGIDDIVDNLSNAVSSAKMSRDEAKAAYKQIENQMAQHASEARMQYNLKGQDIKEAFRDARSRFENAVKFETEKLSSIKSPIQLADDVQTAKQELMNQIKAGSKESYAILDRDPQAYSVRGAGQILRKMADDMNIRPFDKLTQGAPGALVGSAQSGAAKAAASAPITSEAAGVQNKLLQFAQRLENTPEYVDARELKKMIQEIDRSGQAQWGQPGFDKRISEAYKMIRGTIDDVIKTQNDEYRQVMEKVSPKMNLLDGVLDSFKDHQSSISSLNTIGSRTAGENRNILAALGKETGFDFNTAVGKFTGAQKTLKDPNAMEAIANSLPELKDKRLQEMALRQHGAVGAKEAFVEGELSALSGQKQAAGGAIQEAQIKLEQTLKDLEPFKRLNNSQAAVENMARSPKSLLDSSGKLSLAKAPDIETRRALEQLSKLSGRDFIREIENLRVARQFSGEYRNGARNTAMFGAAGFAMGGPMGAAIGGAIGGVVDRFGPQMAQKILEGILKTEQSMSGVSSALSKIASGVGPAAKTALINKKVENAVENSAASGVINRRMERLRGSGKGKPAKNE